MRISFFFSLSIFVSATASADFVDDLEFRHGIAFFDELKYPPDYGHKDYLNPYAPKDGKLVLPWGFSFDTLAPLSIGETGAPSGYHFRGESLVVRGGDEFAAFYGRLANGIAVTADKKTLVFRIHPDARWDDGNTVTAQDVV